MEYQSCFIKREPFERICLVIGPREQVRKLRVVVIQQGKICIFYNHNRCVYLQEGSFRGTGGSKNQVKIVSCELSCKQFGTFSGNKEAVIIHETLLEQKLRGLIEDSSKQK